MSERRAPIPSLPYVCVFLVVLAFLAQAGDARAAALMAGVLADLSGPGTFSHRSDTYRCDDCSVILISIDTLRADHLGCYDHDRPTSPNIDRFATDAVLFRTAIAQASSTLRSHASIFTSLFGFQHQATRDFPLPEEALTIAEILRDAGYQTAAFTAGGQVDPIYGLGQGFEFYDDTGRHFTRTVEDAIAWLESEEPDKFFVFLHTYEIHAPYMPTAEYLDLVRSAPGSGSDSPWRGERDDVATHADSDRPGVKSSLPTDISMALIDSLNFDFFGVSDVSNEDAEHIALSYDAKIRSVDDGFAVLIERLKEAGLYDDLLIIFTSDHGEEFGEHGAVGRHAHSLHDELLKVPLIVKFPRAAFASTSVSRQVRSIDIAPTITDVLGLQSGPMFQGASLVAAIEGDRRSREAVSEQGSSIVLRTDRWKLYDSRLYDLVADPGESEDVSARRRVVHSALQARLLDFLERPRLTAAEKVEPSEDLLDRLRALGYIR